VVEKVQVVDNGSSRVAYEMAMHMWIKSHPSAPKVADTQAFLGLVANCVSALRGEHPE
jgi:hypothetical protein